MSDIEIVPAILRNTFEAIAEDWSKVSAVVDHIQIDVTDGVFAGSKNFMDIPHLAELDDPHKIELHMMVQTPADFVDDIIELNPGRCVFHVEAFLGTMDLPFVYNTIGEYTSAEMGIAINPDTDIARLTEYLPIIQYVLFMGYNPGYANQEINPAVFTTIEKFHANHPHIPLAGDGHVSKETVEQYVRAGATILNANTAIFGSGNPQENIHQLQLLAQSAA